LGRLLRLSASFLIMIGVFSVRWHGHRLMGSKRFIMHNVLCLSCPPSVTIATTCEMRCSILGHNHAKKGCYITGRGERHTRILLGSCFRYSWSQPHTQNFYAIEKSRMDFQGARFPMPLIFRLSLSKISWFKCSIARGRFGYLNLKFPVRSTNNPRSLSILPFSSDLYAYLCISWRKATVINHGRNPGGLPEPCSSHVVRNDNTW
jgi:hypothetical protein